MSFFDNLPHIIDHRTSVTSGEFLQSIVCVIICGCVVIWRVMIRMTVCVSLLHTMNISMTLRRRYEREDLLPVIMCTHTHTLRVSPPERFVSICL